MNVVGTVVGVFGLVLISACTHTKAKSEPVSGYPIMAVVPGKCPPDTCKRCDLSEIAHRLAGPGIDDCGWSKHSADAEQLVRCGLVKAGAGKPFLAIQSYPGVDSYVASAYFRPADGILRRLVYDSDGSGANCPCAANVVLYVCRSDLRRDPEEPEWLDCDVGDSLKYERVCSERGGT
jgi:hypothetical protein